MPSPSVVSIACICYNHEKYISDALDSFLYQTANFKFEIVIGDDCSTDGTWEILSVYQKRFPDIIKLLPSNENIGVAKNFLRTLRACQSNYIAICEGDDFWIDRFKLQKQFNFLEANLDYSISFHNAFIINEDRDLVSESKLRTYEKCDRTSSEMIGGKILPTLTVMFRSKYLQYIPESFVTVTNLDTFLFAIIGSYGKGKYMDNVIPAVYRRHGGGIWSLKNIIMKEKSSLNTYRVMFDFFKNRRNNIDLSLLGNRLFRISLLNVAYSDGVKNKIYTYLNSFKYLSFNRYSLSTLLLSHIGLFRRLIRTRK